MHEFETEIAEFVTAHWSGVDETHGYAASIDATQPASSVWFDALVARGWSVPSWPAVFGGPDWTRREQLVFEQTLAKLGAPSPSNLATQFVAPLMMQHGEATLRADLLEDIRLRRVAWCVGYTDLASHRVNLSRDGLNGIKAWVSGAEAADCMLLTALDASDTKIWCWVSLRSDGIEIEPVPMMGSEASVCQVKLSAVSCPPDQQVRGISEHWSPPLGAAAWTRAARLARSLARFDEYLEREQSGLALDADLRSAHATLRVDLAALEGLEMRGADAWQRGEDAQALNQLATLKGVATGQDLSTLVSRCMGYYAVPYPDELLLSNEGVIGDELALPAVKQMLFDRAWSLHTAAGAGESVEQVKNRIAVEVLGLPADDDEQGD